MLAKIIEKRVSQVLLWVAPAVTLVVSPFVNFDPISVPKMMVLATVSFATFGICLFSRFKEIVYISKAFSILTLLFVISMLIPIFASGANLGQQFWGTFGRNTGFLTYFSLALLAWIASNATSEVFGEKVVKSLLVTAILVTIYCIIQIAGYDPIQWSLMDTFATLGNINFLSAFLGLSSITALVILIGSKNSPMWRVCGAILLLSGLPIIWSTGSIQGLMMFVLGAYIVFFLFIRSIVKSRMFGWIYISLGIAGGYFGLRGLRNDGPLASFLYQPSVTFREDYMHAAWEMLLLKPLTGVGLDSYGDWYRQVRGQISTVRTDPERVSNSAHNIFLDLASGGGVLVVLLYLSIYIFCFYQCFRYIKNSREFDPTFVALFASWCGYILQALISINQVGLGVWGALLLGALARHTRSDKSKPIGEEIKKAKVVSNVKAAVLPAKVALASYFVAALGLLAAFPPLKIDSDFRKASTPELSLLVAKSTLASTFYKEITLQRLIEKSQFDQAKLLATEIVQQRPRSFYAWRMLALLPNSSPSEIETARTKLKELDPFNPTIG
jgi:O-antigen ligase